MQVWGVTQPQLQAIADDLGLDIRFGNTKGNAISCTLRWDGARTPDHYRHKSISWSGERNTPAACFHAHFDFMYEVFDRYHHARIKTTLRGIYDYQGRLDFYIKAQQFAQQNIGSQIMPIPAFESCDCGVFGLGIRHGLSSHTRVMDYAINRGWNGWPNKTRKRKEEEVTCL